MGYCAANFDCFTDCFSHIHQKFALTNDFIFQKFVLIYKISIFASNSSGYENHREI